MADERKVIDWSRFLAFLMGIGFASVVFLGLVLIAPTIIATLTNVGGQIAQLQQEVSGLKNDKAQLETELRSSIDRKQESEMQIQNLNTTIAGVQAENNGFKSTIQTLNQNLQTAKGNIKALELTNSKLNEQLTELRDSISKLESEAVGLRTQVSQLRGENTSLSTGNSELSEDIKNLKEKLDTCIGIPLGPVLFSDSFNDGEVAPAWAVAGNWIETGGVFSAEGQSSGGAVQAFIGEGRFWSDYVLELDVSYPNPGYNAPQFGLVVRAADFKNYVMFYYSRGEIGFQAVRDGAMNRLSKQSYQLSANAHVRIEVSGNKITASVNGVVVDAISGSFPTEGMPGIYIYHPDSRSISFDNIRVIKIE